MPHYEDMQLLFTPAAERALACASDWRSQTGCDALGTVELLAGLLAEPECRAAVMLARHGVDVASVCRQWPLLGGIGKVTTPQSNGEAMDPGDSLKGGMGHLSLSDEVECSLVLAAHRLQCLPRPLELATEHLLLGLALADHAVAYWLRAQGLDPDAIEEEILRLHSVAAPLAPRVEPLPVADSPSPQNTDTKVIRILDAAANRAREGLRVVEDYVRFVLDDQHLTRLCKELRHDLTAALSEISRGDLLAARETQEDVGTALTTPAERHRDDADAVLRANMARLQESLRSVEEYSKLQHHLSDVFKQLRYRTYTIERAIGITRDSQERLAAARLYVLLDSRESSEEFEQLARSLIDAGVHALQLRDKRLDDRQLLARARLLRSLTRETETLFIVNDRPDIAVLVHADGVHVGQEEFSVKDARTIVGPNALIGVSTHSIEQARQAVLDGANYIGVGPVFPSETKQFGHYPGLDLLRAVAAEIRLPAFAIGGICPENLSEVLATGITRIAVGAAITTATNPAEVARKML